MSWDIIRAEEYCLSVRDGTHDTPKPTENGHKLITGKHIRNGQIDTSDAYYISEKDYMKICERSKVDKWDVLMSMIGNGLGRSAVVKETPEYAIKNLALFKVGDEYKAKWLHYFLSGSIGQGLIYNSLQGSGQPFISLSYLRDFPIPNPPYNVIKKVVSILEKYDDLIENNQKQIKLLEEAAQRLYKEWFVDLRFPGYENVKVVDGVPEGWTYKILSDIFDYVRGKSYKSTELSDNSGVLMVNLKNIRAYGGYNRNAEKRFIGKIKEEQKISAGDIVMGVTDMTQERRLVGHVAIVPNFGETVTFSMDLIKLVPKTVTRGYLYSTMFFGGYSKKISPLANGVNVLHLKPESMMNMEMLVPSQKVMEQFEFMFEPYREKIESLQNQCDIAAEARDRLLPKLMSGELEV